MLNHTASLSSELASVGLGLIVLSIGIPASAWVMKRGSRAAGDVSKAPLLPQSQQGGEK